MEENINVDVDVVACLRHCHQEMSCDDCQLKYHKGLCDNLEKLAADEIEKLQEQLRLEHSSYMETRAAALAFERDNLRLQNAYDLMKQLAIHLADRNAFPCEYCSNDSDCPHRHSCPINGYYCFTPNISKI